MLSQDQQSHVLSNEHLVKEIYYFHSLFISGIRVFLRGKGHVEWKVTRGGERRTVKEDQYFIDEKQVVWGKGMYIILGFCIFYHMK